MTTSNALDQALALVAGQQAEMERLLRVLVAENSHTPEKARVDRVGALLREAFTLPGLSVEIRASQRSGDHLAWATAAPGPYALLVGHHDTVFPPGTFEGLRDDGPLLRGPGVLDMKGGLVVIRTALWALATVGALEKVPLRVLSVGDEETGSQDSRAFTTALCQGASAALVFEAGRAADAIITQRKGTGTLTVVATGKAAHAGNAPQDGVNAIWALARFIDAAQQQNEYPRGISVNVGKVAGGIGKNTVPDHAEALLDLRFTTTPDGEALIERLRAAARAAAVGLPGSTVELQGGISRLPLERTEASAALKQRYAACARACGLGGGEAPLLGGGSDANTTSAAGVPSIDGLGPRGKGFHTLDEHIERESLVPKAQALVRFLLTPA